MTPIEKRLAAFAAAKTPVTVTRTDGRTHTGTIAETGDPINPWKVLTGRRGRPAVFHGDDVASIVEEAA